MAREKTLNSKVVSSLALFYESSHKEIGRRSGLPQKSVSRYLRPGKLDRRVFERLLAAINCPPAAVSIAMEFVDSLEALGAATDLSPEEIAEIESASRATSRLVREALIEAVRRGRSGESEGYPEVEELATSRERATELWRRIEGLPDDIRTAVVHVAREFQNWALCELVGEESAKETSRDLASAVSMARLAEEIAAQISGPEGWRNRVQGFAAAHAANILRVSGKLRAADRAFEKAKGLWHAGSDPDSVLDPGRLLDLEASLRRDQRRFDEALSLMDEAIAISRFPARILINVGFTLEVMGEHERAIKTLLDAGPLVESQADPRLSYMRLFNLAVNLCHLGRHVEASELLQQVRIAASDRGDDTELYRVTWLEGRIAVGTGRVAEGRHLLNQARQGFADKRMWYDFALALLESASLLLNEGRTVEVRALASELNRLFESEGVHREALAALRLFYEAAQGDLTTTEFTQAVLRYLFRARYDQGLRFTL